MNTQRCMLFLIVSRIAVASVESGFSGKFSLRRCMELQQINTDNRERPLAAGINRSRQTRTIEKSQPPDAGK